MSRPFHQQCIVVIKRFMGARCRKLLEENQPEQNLSHLEIQQMRCVKALVRIKRAKLNPFAKLGAQYELDGRRSINDDQRLSRSARTKSDAAILPRYAARPFSRSRISSGVGYSASLRASRIK